MGNEVSGPIGEDQTPALDAWNVAAGSDAMVQSVHAHDSVVVNQMNLDHHHSDTSPPLTHQQPPKIDQQEQPQQQLFSSYQRISRTQADQLNDMEEPLPVPLPHPPPPLGPVPSSSHIHTTAPLNISYPASIVRQPITPTPSTPARTRNQMQTTHEFLGSVIESAGSSINSSELPAQHITTVKEQLASIQEVMKRHQQQRLETAQRLRQELQAADARMAELAANRDPFDAFDALIQAHRNKRARFTEHVIEPPPPTTPYPAETTMGVGVTIDETSVAFPFSNAPIQSREQLYSPLQCSDDYDMSQIPQVYTPGAPSSPLPSSPPDAPLWSSVSPPQPSPSPANMSTNESGRSITLNGRKVDSGSALSKALLHNYVSSNILGRLEHDYETGRLSSDAVRHHAMMIADELEPDDQDQLLTHFNRMNLKESATGATSSYTTSRPLDPANHTQSKTNQPAAASSPVDFLKHLQGSSTTKTTMTTPLLQEDLPVFDDQLTLAEPVADDLDGVARIRMIFLYSTPEEREREPNNQQHPLTKKRKSESSSSTSSVMTRSNGVQSTTNQLELNPDTTIFKSGPNIIYRTVQINHAYHRLIGYSQLEASQLFRMDGHRVIYRFVRSDHLTAYHQILMSFRLNHTNECVMSGDERETNRYHVLLDKSGRELYCLVHTRVVDERGVLLEAVQSIMPLPNDPDRPPPPFIPGVDLSIDTLLHGYKPQTNAQVNVSVL